MPLYEAMWSGARRPSGAGPTPAGGDLEVRFGGVVRLPAGVLLLGIAGVLVILVLAYAAGYARAGAEADRRIEQLMLEHRADLGDARFAAVGAGRRCREQLGGVQLARGKHPQLHRRARCPARGGRPWVPRPGCLVPH